MKKITALFLTIISLIVFLFFNSETYAQTGGSQSSTQSEAQWIKDADVTFSGKSGARSGEFLDWTLQRYNWSYVAKGQSNPIAGFWANIRNITYAFLILFVLGTAFLLIITRGKNITIMRFIPRFIFIVILITFSFALVQFIYQIMDIIQGFFLTVPGSNPTQIISQKNLLNIGFGYKDFQGFRIYGPEYDESVFISLLLVKLTALTYYVMSGILLLRKIILWFFIIISPIFPLLLFYSPIRNTAKIWVGEFFRWLLYGPLFAIFLAGLVQIWRSDTNIPLNFAKNSDVIYPTAINILLGGPQQILSLTNSINNKDTFALYIVALLMLWVVIILPFLLLQIFLDYIYSLSEGEDNWFKQLMSNGSNLMAKVAPGSNPPAPVSPTMPYAGGLAKNLPYGAKIEIPEVRADSATFMSQAARMHIKQANMEIANLANLNIPTMRDIAKYETALLSKESARSQDVMRMHQSLQKIANPKSAVSTIEREKYSSVGAKLSSESQKGNQLAGSILTASNIAAGAAPAQALGVAAENIKLIGVLQNLANPENATSSYDKQRLKEIKAKLTEASKGGDSLASSILDASEKGNGEISEDLKQKIKEAKEKGNEIASVILQQAGILDLTTSPSGNFPVANRVQSVNIDDYESVRKIWIENYQNLEVPKALEGKERNRKEWIKEDVSKIDQTITELLSSDPQNINKGMESVGTILPFLLIGGFSQTEVISYLKAKLEAAKTVLSEITKKEEEEETLIDTKEKKHVQLKEMSAKAEAHINKEELDKPAEN